MSDTAPNDTLALPGDALRDGVVTALRDALGDGLIDSLIKPNDDIWVRVSAESWQQAGLVLRDVVGCDYFCFLSAIDWMPSPWGRGEDDPTAAPVERDTNITQGYAGGETRMQVFARVRSISTHLAVTIKADVADTDLANGVPSIETWIPVYAGANWHERECHEMFGIGFQGHPDLRNMYLPTDFEGHPLRKDFPLLARLVKPWPGIVDVEPLPGGDDEEEAAE